jgi:hypothetical protein
MASVAMGSFDVIRLCVDGDMRHGSPAALPIHDGPITGTLES